jgi:hypothetical protein
VMQKRHIGLETDPTDKQTRLLQLLNVADQFAVCTPLETRSTHDITLGLAPLSSSSARGCSMLNTTAFHVNCCPIMGT